MFILQCRRDAEKSAQSQNYKIFDTCILLVALLVPAPVLPQDPIACPLFTHHALLHPVPHLLNVDPHGLLQLGKVVGLVLGYDWVPGLKLQIVPTVEVQLN